MGWFQIEGVRKRTLGAARSDTEPGTSYQFCKGLPMGDCLRTIPSLPRDGPPIGNTSRFRG